jgi:ribonuclease R
MKRPRRHRQQGPARQPARSGKPRSDPLPPRTAWVGILHRRGKSGVLRPYRDDADWRVQVAPRDFAGARDGEVVEVVPVERPRRAGRESAAPRGRVRARFGRPGDPEADFRAVAWRHGLPLEFPAQVQAEADAMPEALPTGELLRRVDLRELPFVTIDPPRARDHDDAVCAESVPGGGARLWVAIADVSHYVPLHSSLDAEALRRGNSVYFPDRAIPMLPERLSGDLCSLRPGRDRLALVVELRLDAAGAVQRKSFCPAVIRSRAHLTYAEAEPLVQGEGPAAPGPDPGVRDSLRELGRASRALRRARERAGALELDLPVAELRLDETGRAQDVLRAPRGASHRAVEEAMLAANRAVAEALAGSGEPAIYRNHEPPGPEEAEALCALLDSFGLLEAGARDAEALAPRALARALERVAERPEARFVHASVLRSLSQARYEARCRGHFALAFSHYAHFTSPIRRYADLVVHRCLKALLAEVPGRRELAPLRPDAARRIAERLSSLERLAEQAERESMQLAKCAFLAPRVGQEFDASVTGVAAHGLYATPDPFFTEGLVHISRLPGYLELSERGDALVARRTRERYRLGDRLRLRLESVDLVKAHINFALVKRL